MQEVPGRRRRSAPEALEAQELRRAIADVADRRERAAAAFTESDLEYVRTLLAAHRRGLSWSAIAEAAGLDSGDQARARAERAMGDDEVSPSRRRAATGTRRPAPGVSVAEAARLLQVARSTIYDRIDRGELQATVDHLGRTRVLLDD